MKLIEAANRLGLRLRTGAEHLLVLRDDRLIAGISWNGVCWVCHYHTAGTLDLIAQLVSET